MIINELLCYVFHHVNSSNFEDIQRIVNHHYNSDDILDAKRVLWEICSAELGPCPSRQSSENRTATYANMEDIFAAVKKLDAKDKVPEIVAKDLDKLPDMKPAELNYILLLQRVAKLEEYKANNENICTRMATDILQIQDNVRELRTEAPEPGSSIVNIVNNNTGPDIARSPDSEQPPPLEPPSEQPAVTRPPNQQQQRQQHQQQQQQQQQQQHQRQQHQPHGGRPGPQMRGQSRPQIGGRPHNIGRQQQGRQQRQNNHYNHIQGSRRNPSVRNSWQDNNNSQNGRPTQGRTTNSVIGSGSQVGNLRGGPLPSRVIFVSRLETGNIENLSDYIKSKNVKISDIEKMSHPQSRFSSYKMRISVLDKEKVFDPSFWPFGVQCRMWRVRTQHAYNEDHPYNMYSDSDNESEIDSENVSNNVDENVTENNNA